ncbi:iron-sulfur cluster assembly scaffold protein [Patescibacteria group bacterium]|nr:iron-sulfur cluster assembly scaffold protein [Patescibacteria group bacterium]
MNIYAQNILDHYKTPRNFGSISGAQIKHSEANYSCGDKLSVDIKLEADVVSDIKFKGTGCAISQAAMSILTEDVMGKTKKYILNLKFDYLQKLLGVPVSESRYKCAVLGLMTIQNALKMKGNKKN